MIIKLFDKHYRKFLNLVIYSPRRFITTVSKALLFLPENCLQCPILLAFKLSTAINLGIHFLLVCVIQP